LSFEIGKAAIYIGKQGRDDLGTAASIVVVLIWIYHTGMIQLGIM
jgi:hypothetical protein